MHNNKDNPLLSSYLISAEPFNLKPDQSNNMQNTGVNLQIIHYN